MPLTDLHTARSRRRLDRRVAAASRLDAIAATLGQVPHLRRELLFLALSLVAADESDSRADATAAAVLGDETASAS